jgi:hypothetical protein
MSCKDARLGRRQKQRPPYREYQEGNWHLCKVGRMGPRERSCRHCLRLSIFRPRLRGIGRSCLLYPSPNSTPATDFHGREHCFKGRLLPGCTAGSLNFGLILAPTSSCRDNYPLDMARRSSFAFPRLWRHGYRLWR